MWLTRRHLLVAGLAAFDGGPASSAGPIALGGFDPVSYFLDGPEPGRPAYEHAWRGRTWRFARAGNRAAFLDAPGSYAPRLGGFDPVGVLSDRLVDTDPLVFARLRGPEETERLYLFRTPENRGRVIADPNLAVLAEARWPLLRNQIERDFPD